MLKNNSDITFSESVKDELSRIKYSPAEMAIILRSFLLNNLVISMSNTQKWEINSKLQSTIKLIHSFFSKLFNVKQEISFTEVGKFDNKRNYKLTITGDLEKIEKQIKLFNEWPKSSTPSENKCFLIGAFLSGGSISSFATKSTYSLSLRSKNKNYLIAAQDILSKFNISVTIAERRNEHILYIKKASSLSDFLKIIGTNNKMLEFEEIIIARDYINQMHRLVNLDVSNMRKTSSASVKYITMINSIINTPEYNKQSAKFKTYCLLRKQNPGYSLDTLSKKMGDQKLPVTKGGINHLNMKIKKIYMSLNSKKL